MKIIDEMNSIIVGPLCVFKHALLKAKQSINKSEAKAKQFSKYTFENDCDLPIESKISVSIKKSEKVLCYQLFHNTVAFEQFAVY